ncbi:hypothetical protein THAOC_34500 [Thalassiosira oceanica]|uniref:Uncharacterized protein n=2 Tax=Thalassiosira oceanica TaxID=159749 RepID=K0R4U7_THAOC|nr:hypothetical protein THAOC_34500 [Thalassiosira oceanica]|eukprot:EJK46814.1 hypothetical protein THAOC_34500 [Thalassiosira oceanica]
MSALDGISPMSAAASSALYALAHNRVRDAELSEAATAATEVLRRAQVHRPRARYPSSSASAFGGSGFAVNPATEAGDDLLDVIVSGVQPTMHQVTRTSTAHNPSSADSEGAVVQGMPPANTTTNSSFRPIGRGGRATSTTFRHGASPDNDGSSLARPAAGTSPPMPVAGPNDAQHLGTIQCFVRKQLVEYFAADSSQLMKKGRQTAIGEGRIGVRCVFCKDLPKSEQVSQSCSFPNALSKVKSAVSMIQHRHLIKCHSVPHQIKLHLESLKNTKSSQKQVTKNRSEYWVRTATEQGLYDTSHGIRFAPSETVLNTAATRDGEDTPRLITPTEPILAHFSAQAATSSAETIYGNLPPPPPLPPIQTFSSLTLTAEQSGSSTKKRIQNAQDDPLPRKTSKRVKSDLDNSIDWGQFENDLDFSLPSCD